MTALQRPHVASWRPRRPDELRRDQAAGVAAWQAAIRAAQMADQVEATHARSREMRLDLDRRMDVVGRQHAALMERSRQHVQASSTPLRPDAPPRVVVVHRSAWFLDKVVAGLVGCGLDVVARLENGADAVGVSVAEQPDLLFVEDKLPMLGGAEVVRQVLQFAPYTIAAAQVEYDSDIPTMLDVGARAAFPRRLPPADVARELAVLLTA